jgi:hypothetical protein
MYIILGSRAVDAELDTNTRLVGITHQRSMSPSASSTPNIRGATEAFFNLCKANLCV